MNAALMIFPIIILFITFYGAKITKKGLVSDSFIDLGQAKMIQAFACLSVILHHLTQDITNFGWKPKGPITVYSFIGCLCTAVFFFFSGYGLITSLDQKETYLKGFLKHRLPAVLIPFWLINILGIVMIMVAKGRKFSVAEVIGNITGITLVDGNGWFIIEIVFLYIAFYILFSLIKNRDLATALMCAVTLGIIVYSFMQGHDEGENVHWFRGEWWYNSTLTFAYGMVFARVKDRFAAFCVKYYAGMLTLFGVLSVVAIVANIYAQLRLGYYHEPVHHGVRDAVITLVIQSLSCLIVTTLLLIMNMRIVLGNRALVFIGGISLQLFLIHGFIEDYIFAGRGLNDFLYYLAVLAASISCAAVVSPPVKLAVKKVTELLSYGRRKTDTLESRIYEKRRAKRLKVLGIVAAVSTVAAALYFIIVRNVVLKNEYSQESRDLKNAAVGDLVKWGHYDTDASFPGKERVSWIVLEKDGDSALLISEKGLAGSYYHQKHEAVSWKDCDLRGEINGKASSGAFSKFEKADMLQIDGDLISLLTVEEAQKLFSTDEDRELIITAIAKAQGTNINELSKHHYWDFQSRKTSWWWLRGTDEALLTAPIVTVDGEILVSEKYVNKPGGAIRPVIRVSIH